MISDIPSWLKDGRVSDLEMQKIKQNFIFTRVELYASDMLLLQYSVTEGQAKNNLDYTGVKDALIIVLMVESPKAFTEYDIKCDNYIHRFIQMKADSGLSYPMKAKMIYVQLDKCLRQYKAGMNAEAADGNQDELQLWLSMIADVNDEKVTEAAEHDKTLMEIRKEASAMSQEKEVQRMLIQEKYDRMDWVTFGNEREHQGYAEGQKEGRAEGEARGAIKTYKRVGKSPVKELIESDFQLNDDVAEKYVKETLGLQLV